MHNFLSSSEHDLVNFFKDKKFEKVFIICGKKSYINSGAKRILSRCLKDKITKHYYKCSLYPEISELKRIVVSLRNFSPDLVVAVGGGSVLDYAKMANVIEITKNLNEKIVNYSYPIKKKLAELVAIPTTAGSGAEVTTNAVIYINKIKYSLESEIIKPDYFFLIPELVIKGTKKIKSSAGFDAIAQAVESLISKKSTPQSINFAKKSLAISLKYYLDYLKKPNFENTSAMCLAANLSGKAISISKTTAPHAISYPFTSLYNISHGHAVSLTLEKFLKFNFINYRKASCNFDLNLRFKDIFDIFGVKNINELEIFFIQMKKKAKLGSDFEKLNNKLNLNLDRLMNGVNLLRLKNNPIDLNIKDVKKILLKSD
jgi:alcohol dehydrogenase class IV